jgi:hypothetical protein
MLLALFPDVNLSRVWRTSRYDRHGFTAAGTFPRPNPPGTSSTRRHRSMGEVEARCKL